MPPIRRTKHGHHTLAYCVVCEMIAEEDCALGGHETRNVVCCAKHHLEVPCASCAELEKKNKEALEKNEKKEKKEEMAEA